MDIKNRIFSALANKKGFNYGNVKLDIKNNNITLIFSEKNILNITHNDNLLFTSFVLDFLNSVKLGRIIINTFLEYYSSGYIEKDKKTGIWIYCKIKEFNEKTGAYTLNKVDLLPEMKILLK